MRLLTTATIEEQIGELDAYMDEIIRKPRKSITNIVTKVPGGLFLEDVVSGQKYFAGFFTMAGSLSNFAIQLGSTVKDVTLAIESCVDNVTNTINFPVQKGLTNIPNSVDIVANTRVSVYLTSINPIGTATIGYVYTPKVS